MTTSDWRGLAEEIRRASTSTGRAQSGFYSIEGVRLHERALRAGVGVERVLVSAEFLSDPSPRIQALLRSLAEHGCRLVAAPPSALTALTAGRGLGDILGLVRLPSPPVGEIWPASPGRQPPVWLAAVDVEDPGNVGALVRTGHASGINGFIAVGVSDPFHPRAVRTSMGSLFKTVVWEVDSAENLLPLLAAHSLTGVAATVTAGEWLPEMTWPAGGVAILMGNEAWGLPPALLAQAHRQVRIPMAEGVDSFSVNAAAAIVLYELQRARGWGRM